LTLNVLLISTYDLGRQPFGLASPAAWLREAGMEVRCLDLAVDPLNPDAIRSAHLVAVHLPMHMATRMAVPLLAQIRRLNPQAHLCCFGLYAPVNEAYLRRLGVQTVLGGEFETGLVDLARRLAQTGSARLAGEQPEPVISLARQQFRVPDRSGLPPLARYAQLTLPDGRRVPVGVTEASRGCKYLCRHCPIVPVYGGQFRIVQPEVVLADIRQQVQAGARHITFGDPDFFNGPGHAVPLVQALHQEFPAITYDVVIKVEHLLKHAGRLPALKETGCLFITTAVESFDDRILALLDKRHTAADFEAALAHCRSLGLLLMPTFVAFTPWISLAGYRHFLAELARLELAPLTPPIQATLRLLIPQGSYLLNTPEARLHVGAFDEEALTYRWSHPDPQVDRLQADLTRLVHRGAKAGLPRLETFAKIWQHANPAAGKNPFLNTPAHWSAVPFLTEPWYC
jgi:radical SAM superfamily enzyme YgiQ (UPF0313 family)